MIEDIRDAEGFIISFFPPGVEGRLKDDLLQQGFVILLEMLAKYEPGKGGRDAKGSRFSGYAARFFPAKLREAHLKMTGCIRARTQGKRYWVQPPQILSFEQLLPFRRYEALETVDEKDDWGTLLFHAVFRLYNLDPGALSAADIAADAETYLAALGDLELLRCVNGGYTPRGAAIPLHLREIACDPSLRPSPATLYGTGGGRARSGPNLDEYDRRDRLRRGAWGDLERPVDEFRPRFALG